MAQRCLLVSVFMFASVFACAEVSAFDADVKAFVVRYCADCHDGDEPEGGAALDQLVAADANTFDRQLWTSVAKNIEFRRMPPEDAEQPTDELRQRVAGLIRVRLEHVDCSAPVDPGTVTLRRLTRYEYRRTIYELLGLDFAAVSEFPSDDVGHGFDNIGDVLTLSPLHYEKYLMAAEAIAESAIGVADGEYKLQLTGAEIEPTKGSTAVGNAHHLSTAADLMVPLSLPADGRYRFSVTLSPEQAGPNWVRATLLMDHDVVKQVELKKPTGTKSNHEFDLRLKAGQHRLTIRFVNDYFQPRATDPSDRDRNLLVHEVRVDGPFESVLTWSDQVTAIAKDEAGEVVSSSEFVKRFLPLAYRRQVSKSEIDKVLALLKSAGSTVNDQFKMVIKAALVSPNFLYRVERRSFSIL